MATTCELIAKTTLGSDAANIEFTSIPTTYTDLLLLTSMRSNRASTADNFAIEFNGSNANLSCRVLFGQGTGTGSVSASGIYGIAPASNATANTFSNDNIYIPNYAGSTNKSVNMDSIQENNHATNNYIYATAGLWSSTNVISSVKIIPVYGTNFITNSSAYLYGIKKA